MAKAFSGLGATVIDTVADLPAAAAALEGMIVFQKDTNELKICDGVNWISMLDTDNPPALDFVASASPSAVSSININGCFSSKYDNYLILASLVNSSSNNIWIQMRNAGTTDSGTNYSFSYLQYGTSAPEQGRTDAATSFVLGGGNTLDPNQYVVNMFSPFLAKRTMLTSTTNNSNANTTIQVFSGSHRVASSQDSITVTTGSAVTFTGSIRVYGYRNSI